MPENKKDDLANALAAFAAGEHEEADEIAHDEPAELPRPAPAAQAPPRSGLAKPQGVTRAPRPSPPATPGAPVGRAIASPRPAAPSAPPPAAQARPAATARPSAPAPAVPPPSRRSEVPQPRMPVEHPPAEEAPFVSDTAGEWVGSAPDDDDAMLAPAPDASAFAYHAPPSRSTGKKLAQSSEFKQTLIPILLTSGLLLIVFGLLKFILGPDSPYSNLPGWVIGMTCGMGALLLVFALFTMLQVKDQLSRSR